MITAIFLHNLDTHVETLIVSALLTSFGKCLLLRVVQSRIVRRFFGSYCTRFSSKLFCLLFIVYPEAPPRGSAIRTESILIVLDTSVHINENQ